VEGNDFSVTVNVIDSCEIYLQYMQQLFDFEAMKKLVARSDFNMLFDGMHGASGPYA
jgi:phosphoglucomutase